MVFLWEFFKGLFCCTVQFLLLWFNARNSISVVFFFSLELYLFLSLCLPISVFQVMAIVPSHFAWQRVRSEHHSGAQRQYGDRDHTRVPCGPSASPVSCALCHRGTRLDHGPGSASLPRSSSARTPNHSFPHPFTSTLSLESTPPRAAASRRKVVETKSQARHSSCCCAEEVPSEYH